MTRPNPFRRTQLTVHRPPIGSYVDGIWQEGAPTQFDIMASVHPANGKDLEVLPEGKRDGAIFKVITNTELNEVREGERNADQVEIDGVLYEVTRKMAWRNGVLPNIQYLVTKDRS